MIELLHELEIKHLAEDGETVLWRRVDPQLHGEPWHTPAAIRPTWFHGKSMYGSLKFKGGEQPRPGDVLPPTAGLNLRVTLVKVVKLDSLLGSNSAGWYWQIGVEVKK